MNSTATTQTPSSLSLGLAFLGTGLGFALPFYLFPGLDYAAGLGRAPEVLNLFCLVSWMGLSHFVFAYKGHTLAVQKSRSLALKYIPIFLLSMTGLFLLRFQIGYALFSALAWIYFIAHLLKAEMYFSGSQDVKLFTFPLLAFSYFSFAMLAPEAWVSSLSLFLGAGICFLPFVFKSFQTRISDSLSNPLFLIAAFLIGEGLIWGKYRPFMTPGFRDGVYTIHVALASFYHYFKSYNHMLLRNQGRLSGIVITNLVVISLGLITLFYLPESPLIYLFGVQYFTVWVWLHQWMSDVFNRIKKRTIS